MSIDWQILTYRGHKGRPIMEKNVIKDARPQRQFNRDHEEHSRQRVKIYWGPRQK